MVLHGDCSCYVPLQGSQPEGCTQRGRGIAPSITALSLSSHHTRCHLIYAHAFPGISFWTPSKPLHMLIQFLDRNFNIVFAASSANVITSRKRARSMAVATQIRLGIYLIARSRTEGWAVPTRLGESVLVHPLVCLLTQYATER